MFTKNRLNKKLDGLFKSNKLKAYFKYNNTYNPTTENQISLFKPKTNKKWRPDKNDHFHRNLCRSIQKCSQSRRVN